MYFKNLNLKNDGSLLKSMNLAEHDIDNFVIAINNLVIEKNSKSLVLAGLDNMSKQEEKCFCYLAMIGYQSWINKSISNKNMEN